MLNDFLYGFIDECLQTRPLFFPRPVSPVFPDGFKPRHLDCYGTARKVHEVKGYPVIAGLAFLDKDGKLYPWPHMVNAVGPTLADGLVDASPVPDQRNLGFVPVKLTETKAWNAITAAYMQMPGMGSGSRWQDANADKLTQEYLPWLRGQADFAQLAPPSIEIPASMPAA
jgi:hypothetical protein